MHGFERGAAQPPRQTPNVAVRLPSPPRSVTPNRPRTLDASMNTSTEHASFYEAVGGEDTFHRLVSAFYRGVAEDPVLRPVYPSKNLGSAEEHLRLFLIQYWGGPRTYDELRGHPRLRMRHAHFVIGEAERDAWLRQMRAAMDEIGLDEAHDTQLWDYLVMAAHSLMNAPRESRGPDLGLTPA